MGGDFGVSDSTMICFRASAQIDQTLVSARLDYCTLVCCLARLFAGGSGRRCARSHPSHGLE